MKTTLRYVGIAAFAVVLFAGVGIARADNVKDVIVLPNTNTIYVGGSTTVGYYIQATGNPSGCDAADGSAATVTINTPAQVSATPASLVFTACDSTQTTVLGSNQVGDYDITVGVTDSVGNYNVNTAKFTLHVLPIPDATAPVIIPTVTGTLGNNGWYTSDVQVSWSVTDPETAITSMSGCDTVLVTADTTGTTFTCTATSTGGTSSQSVTIKRDATAPVIALTSRTAANGAGWNNTDVLLAWSCTDATSGPVAAALNQTVSGEGAGQTATATCEDMAGNTASDTQTDINIDTTAPDVMITTPADGVHYTFHQIVLANWSATDSLSGIDTAVGTTANGSAIDTNSLGVKTFTVTATDRAGNTTMTTVSYTVDPYVFGGWQTPITIDSKTFKKTSTVPVKFMLTDNGGAPVGGATATLTVDGVAAKSSGSSNYLNYFRYDPVAGQYIFNLSTKMLTIGTHTLMVTLDDGTTQSITITVR